MPQSCGFEGNLGRNNILVYTGNYVVPPSIDDPNSPRPLIHEETRFFGSTNFEKVNFESACKNCSACSCG